MKPAYYNEIDEYAAAMLRNLIAAGHIAPGEVDTRSIEDVKPDDLRGFTQCHFFAGIGVWSYALRRAGWPDDRPIWTGSCPCQPFSAAGKGDGFADERHLWPAWFHLISQHRPAVLAGEQVASKDADPWIDLVHADLEALGYAFGAVPFPSAGVGAPHIRDRLYWVADADVPGQRSRGRGGLHRKGEARALATLGSELGRLGDTIGTGLAQRERERERGILGRAPGAVKGEAAIGAGIHLGRLADAERARVCGKPGGVDSAQAGAGNRQYLHDPVASGDDVRPGPTNGYWSDADWLGCRDGKWRPVEPGTFPLAHGAPARVGRLRAGWDAPAGTEGQGHRAGRLRGYGNAINAEAARVFIEAMMGSLS